MWSPHTEGLSRPSAYGGNITSQTLKLEEPNLNARTTACSWTHVHYVHRDESAAIYYREESSLLRQSNFLFFFPLSFLEPKSGAKDKWSGSFHWNQVLIWMEEKKCAAVPWKKKSARVEGLDRKALLVYLGQGRRKNNANREDWSECSGVKKNPFGRDFPTFKGEKQKWNKNEEGYKAAKPGGLQSG